MSWERGTLTTRPLLLLVGVRGGGGVCMEVGMQWGRAMVRWDGEGNGTVR